MHADVEGMPFSSWCKVLVKLPWRVEFGMENMLVIHHNNYFPSFCHIHERILLGSSL